MKTNRTKIATTAAVALIAWLLLPETGSCFYNPSTGRWLNRDPLNAFSTVEARYRLLLDSGQDQKTASAIAMRPPELGECVAFRNAPSFGYDLLGLCVELPGSGAGAFWNNLAGHQWPVHGPASTLTFTVCCPLQYPYLSTYGVASTGPPMNPPGDPTAHGAAFPASFRTLTPPSGSGPCYTIVIIVTSSASLEAIQHRPPSLPFVYTVRIVGGCCCEPAEPIVRADPPVNPGTFTPPGREIPL